MSLWWMQPGWADARCACGATIYPEGDPDWGACFTCFDANLQEREAEDRALNEAYERDYRAALATTLKEPRHDPSR